MRPNDVHIGKLNLLQNTPLLATKLHLSSPSAETMARPRLIRRLNRCAQSRLTLLCAPAGFGKSTLLQQWAQQASERPAWLSIDSADNDPIRFWRYVISSIDSIRPGFEEKAADIVKLIHPSEYETALTLLLNELQQSTKPITLILDDFHAITSEGLLVSFRFFLEYLPEHVHLIVSSRTEIPVSTAKLFSGLQMDRLNAEELRFTLQEGTEYYWTCMALELPEEETNEWVRRTEGGLRP